MTNVPANNYGDTPSNSRKSKEEAQQSKPDKLAKIIKDDVSVTERKRPVGRRFLDAFSGDDSRTVGQYILFDVVLPSVKSIIVDAVSGGVERLIYGDNARPTGMRRGYGGGIVNNSRTNYQQASNTAQSRVGTRNPRAVHDFNEIVLDNRGAAEEVIDALTELISNYGKATVSDFYELVGITGSYTDDKWGWFSMVGAHTERVGNGFLIALPRTEPVN